MAIEFYKEFGPLGYLATYSNHGFYKDGVFWKTSEHYYQAQKFKNKEVQKLIINAPTPKLASEIGRDRRYKIRDDWDEIKQDIMFEAVLFKFQANHDILFKLLETGDEEIIEKTEKENYWGCGPLKDGQNNYGKILAKVRNVLKKNQNLED